jgi:hypothetical protein
MHFQILAFFFLANGVSSAMVPNDQCELPNGFKFEVCGTGAEQKCCTPDQQCISATPKDGDEQFACSAERKLVGDKVIKIVILPVLFTVGSLSIIAFMLRRWGVKNVMTCLLVAQVAASTLLFFSPFWVLGFYSVLLAVFVGFTWTAKDLVWWVYRVAMFLQVFQVIAIFGPFETFHVPFSDLSYKAQSRYESAAAGMGEAQCSSSYGGFFTFHSIELAAEGMDPTQTTFGYCVEGWLGFVQLCIIFLGLLQAGVIFYSAQRFAANEPSKPLPEAPKQKPQIKESSAQEGAGTSGTDVQPSQSPANDEVAV